MSYINLSQKLKKEKNLSKETDTIKCEKNNCKVAQKRSSFYYKSKWKCRDPGATKASVLAAKVVGNAAILMQPDTFHIKCFEFFHQEV